MFAAFVPATPDDIETAIAFMSQLYSRVEFDEPRARSSFQDLLAHPECGGLWFIRADGHPAGYIVLTICYSLEFHGRFALLDELFVAPSWRSQGLGRQALAFADEFCRTHTLKAIRLEVALQNPRAIALYQDSGYRIDDRHLMTKWL